ncbi:MerR family transcriptional regulator [Candidatus Neomarinimicrobiota bacterium]
MKNDHPGIKKLYYSIGEVSKITHLKSYVLRYWETEFRQINPPKNRAGNRTYRQKDIDLILRIKDLLYNQKYTIKGARTALSGEASIPAIKSPATLEDKKRLSPNQVELLKEIRSQLKSILESIANQ